LVEFFCTMQNHATIIPEFKARNENLVFVHYKRFDFINSMQYQNLLIISQLDRVGEINYIFPGLFGESGYLLLFHFLNSSTRLSEVSSGVLTEVLTVRLFDPAGQKTTGI